jgi:dTDP-glucose 4,6-dehydratase
VLKSDLTLVTGSSGLLGRELVGQLAGRGLRIRGLDRAPRSEPQAQARGDLFESPAYLANTPAPTFGPRIEHFHADLLDPATCHKAFESVATIVHTAALQHHSVPPRWGRERFFSANVAMTRNVVNAAVAAGVRHIVLVSSDMVYGLPSGGALRESDAPRPIGPYGRSKLASEQLCQSARQRGLTVTILRPRLIVGPGRLGVLTRLFDRIRAGRSVPMLGDGGNRYQMVGAADVAAACVAAIDRPIDGVFNLGSSDPPTVRELLKELCRRAGTGSRVRELPLAPANAALWMLHAVRLAPLVPEQFRIAAIDYVLDTSAAARDLGWTPRLNDTEMLWQAYQAYCGSILTARTVPAESVGPLTQPGRLTGSLENR